MTTRTRPYNVKQSDLRPEWHVVDARGKTLGRVSTEIATLLQGKHKPTYTPHLAAGDFVVVVNASKFRVSGNKLAAKMYYRHSGYHGGLTEQTLEELLEKHPTRALRQAVKGMLPKNIRGKHMLSRLKLYEGEEHPHQAQVSASRAQAAPLAPPAPTAEAAQPEPAPEPEAELQQDEAAQPEPAPEPEAELQQDEAAQPEPAPEPEAELQQDEAAQPEPAPEPEAELQQDEAAEVPLPEEQAAEVEAAEAGRADAADEEELEALTVPRLRELAAERGITVPSRARKADIIEALRS